MTRRAAAAAELFPPSSLSWFPSGLSTVASSSRRRRRRRLRRCRHRRTSQQTTEGKKYRFLLHSLCREKTSALFSSLLLSAAAVRAVASIWIGSLSRGREEVAIARVAAAPAALHHLLRRLMCTVLLLHGVGACYMYVCREKEEKVVYVDGLGGGCSSSCDVAGRGLDLLRVTTMLGSGEKSETVQGGRELADIDLFHLSRYWWKLHSLFFRWEIST